MTEKELVRRCRQGDREAQRELYAQTSERIYGLLLKMTRNADDAFDLAQDTYVLAFKRMDQFDGSGPVGGWLRRIAVNEALQFFRRSERDRSHLKLLPAEDAATCAQDEDAVRIDMEDALGQLEPADRTILLLRYDDGLNYREIAAVMACREGTVASRLNRAREKLRALLQKSYGPGEESGDAKHHPSSRVYADGA